MTTTNYTLVVTSCERPELLKQTLLSFAMYADIEPIDTVVIEDGNSDAPAWFENIQGLGKLRWLKNGVRRGQTYSIDRVYSEVKTEYLFHSEEDWLYTRTGFIKESLDILAKYSDISMVGIRGKSEHPEFFDAERGFNIRQKDWNGWGGISWNPGLRRLEDYNRIGKFGNHVDYDLTCHEHKISTIYRSLGFFMASLPVACKHIGADHKVWSRAVVLPKILVTIPACHQYYVGNLAHENYDKHQNTFVGDQILACRETWLKDSKLDYKFFYGQGADREPGEDEVFLDVPDDYRSLTKKLKATCKWALDHGYEYIFKCDDDTYVWADRLRTSGFEHHDYVGYDWACNSSNKHHCFAGGFACWFSAKAAKVIADALDTTEPADDVWAGHMLRDAGIKLVHDARYHPNNANKFINIEDVPLQHAYIALHACDSETIRQLHERAWMLSDSPVSNATGFTEADRQSKTFEQELADLMGGLQV